jgi:hypothetical protein
MNIVHNISIECNIQVAQVLKMTKEKAQKRLAGNLGRIQFREFTSAVTGVVKIDYPLTNPDFLEIEAEHAFGGILWEIANRYKEIYAGEDKTATEVESLNPQLINRGRSNGNYGIWGHDLEDLYFEGLQIFGKEIVILIGS